MCYFKVIYMRIIELGYLRCDDDQIEYIVTYTVFFLWLLIFSGVFFLVFPLFQGPQLIVLRTNF